MMSTMITCLRSLPFLSSSSSLFFWPIYVLGDPPSSSTQAAGNTFLADSRGGPAAGRRGRSGEAAKGLGERGAGGHQVGGREKWRAARVLGVKKGTSPLGRPWAAHMGQSPGPSCLNLATNPFVNCLNKYFPFDPSPKSISE